VCKKEGVDENVGEFFADLGWVGRLGVLPEEAFEQLTRLDR
jgi:hypothetical protein